MYWPGSSKYLECDVETYNDEEKVFMCYYASDGATEKERLLDSMDGPEAWQWLDESLEEVTITGSRSRTTWRSLIRRRIAETEASKRRRQTNRLCPPTLSQKSACPWT